MGGCGSCLGKTVKKLKYRVLMVGLDNAGKTTILYKLALNEIVSTIPTVGLNIETITYKNIKFNVWDVGGQKKIRSMWNYYYKNTDAIIFVIDSNELKRIDKLKNDNCKQELYKLLSHPLLKNAVLLILANKQDLPNAININELTKRLQLESLKNRIWMIQETCAITGDGLYDGLEWLSNVIKCNNKKRKNKYIVQNTQRYNQL